MKLLLKSLLKLLLKKLESKLSTSLLIITLFWLLLKHYYRLNTFVNNNLSLYFLLRVIYTILAVNWFSSQFRITGFSIFLSGYSIVG